MINRFYRFDLRRTGIRTASNSKSTGDRIVLRVSLKHLLNIIPRNLHTVRYKCGLKSAHSEVYLGMEMCLNTILTGQSLAHLLSAFEHRYSGPTLLLGF